jgi:predicted NUDIX family phosphoesterase
MTGYRSKKMSSDIRWLGPYAPAERHADDVTLAHVVELRKKVAELDEQLARVMSWVIPMQRENVLLRKKLTGDDDDVVSN